MTYGEHPGHNPRDEFHSAGNNKSHGVSTMALVDIDI